MAHTVRDKKKLRNRVRRIQGQVEAIAKALEAEADCTVTLRTIASARGAINGLMAEVIDGHVRYHVADPDQQPNSERSRAVRDLLDIVKAYLR